MRGYFTLAHSNIDKTDTVAVGGLTGSEFSKQYEDLVKKKPIMVSVRDGKVVVDKSKDHKLYLSCSAVKNLKLQNT